MYNNIEGLAENWGANMHFFKSEGALAPLPPTSDTYDIRMYYPFIHSYLIYH